MSVPFVDLKVQYESIKDEIDDAIATVINQTSFIGGALINAFEEDFAGCIGMKHCVGVANGTDAIEIALQALGIGPGDEVLVPALTWISTAGAVNNVGAEPVFVDVLPNERTIDPSLIAAKITSKTKAMIPVHLYGLPARMDELMLIAESYGLKVLEDCAQAHLATVNGQQVGTFGDAATFSFYPGKNLGAYGDAGCIVTNQDEVANTSRMIANHGQVSKHDHRIIGRNSRLDTMQAAILKAKLPYLSGWTTARNQVAKWYNAGLTNVIKPEVPTHMAHVFHLYVIQSDRRDELMAKLKGEKIGCAIHYPNPLPFLKSYAYKAHQEGEFPIAEKLCGEIISLPMYAELREDQVESICEIVNHFHA